MVELSLIYDKVRWEEKALYEAASRMNIALRMVDAEEVIFDISSNRPDENFGDVVLERCVSHYTGFHTAAILEGYGYKVINPSEVIRLCGNKLLTTILLRRAGVPVPKTYVAFTARSALKAFDKVGYPAMLKPVLGSWGRLVSLISDETAAKVALEHRELMYPLYQVYYIQENIERPPRDIRVFVIGDEIPVAIYRLGPPNDWRTNTARGGKVAVCKITPEIEELAFKSARAIGSGIFGVDMMESNKGLVVHEVNSTIEFRNTVPATGVKLQDHIINYAVREAKR